MKTKTELPPELLKTSDVARMLNLTPVAVRDLARRDPTFPAPIQLGSAFSLRYVREELIAWRNACKRHSRTGVDAVTMRKQMRAASEQRVLA